MTTNISNFSMHDVRRLAPASIFVIQQHAAVKASIAAYAPTMVPLANEVLVAIRTLDMLKADQVALMAASKRETNELHGVMLEWSGHLGRDLEGFDLASFSRDATLTFDVGAKASSLKQLVEQKGAHLHYREALLTELTARIDSANEAQTGSQAARVALQEKQREVRELMAAFYKELIALRRTVRAALGSSHFDSQRLRATGRARVEEPPGEGAGAGAEPSEPQTRGSSDA
jgi:hypothetical protein